MEIVVAGRKREAAFHHTIMTYLFCLVFEEYATVYIDTHEAPGSGDAMRKLAQEIFREALAGSCTAHSFQTVIAPKID